jgi:TolB-like protein/class 3 adenylate cyclase/rhodanese-related sulfurtransferase/Flp pilus assembly protein TadD
MDTHRSERRLSAIMATDIVGYSRLMEADEARTLAAIKALRSDLIDPLLAQFRGRIAKLMGDGAIIEFGSVVDAVACAVELQKQAAARQTEVSPESRILFRIGINLGDVVVEGDDLLGDGVNIAARLEQFCDPGGILVSGTAYDQLQGKLDRPLEFIGEQRMKNISRPVRAYRVKFDGSSPGLRLSIRRFRKWAAPVAAVILLVGGSALWVQPWDLRMERASLERMALPLPDKPSLAVLPFNNLSGDPEQSYFADGITEDLITDLSNLSGIFVIARNSTWTYKDKPTKVQQVAEDLGVRYVLEGSVRRNGDQVRINAQLVDALNGRHLWAERYDGSAKEVFALQDRVIQQIVAALAVNLTWDERSKVGEAETSVPEAYDAFLQGWDLYRRETKEDVPKAISFFEQAIKLDPQYGRAYAGLAAVYWRAVTLFWQAAVGIEYERAYAGLHENLAKALEKPTPLAYSISAELLARKGRSEEALAQIDRALVMAANEADTHFSRARILNAMGRAPEAEKAAWLAMRLNPYYGPDYLTVLGQALLHQERYQEAAEYIERAVNRQPENEQHYVTLAITYGHLGFTEEAREAVKKYNEMAAKGRWAPLTVQEVAYWWYGNIFSYDEVYRERLQQGLRKAGVPEGAGTDIKYADLKRLIRNDDGEYEVVDATKIDAAQANALHSEGAVFVDVRGPDSFGAGHIPSAVNLEMSSGLSKDSLARLISKDDKVIFYCVGKYCPRSTYACAKALLWGYSQVYYFAGGFPAWKNAGYPIETTTAPGY